MTKIAMIGAGSVVFVKKLLADILAKPELHNATIALHDIDAERLETSGMMARWTAKQLGANPVVEEHADRRSAIAGADFVIMGLPVAASLEVVAAAEQSGARIIDMSGAFRVPDASAFERYYGAKHPRPDLLGEFVYAAYNDSVIEDEALLDPYNGYMTMERDFGLSAPSGIALGTSETRSSPT